MALLLLASAQAPRALAGGVDIVVNTTSPTSIPDGVCSLGEAITAFNLGSAVNGDCTGSIGRDTIVFNVDPGTPFMPTATGLPHITKPVIINGNSGGADRIEIRGPAGPLVSGMHNLHFEPDATGSIVNRLVVNNSADDGILIDADQVQVLGSFIGTSADGMSGAKPGVRDPGDAQRRADRRGNGGAPVPALVT